MYESVKYHFITILYMLFFLLHTDPYIDPTIYWWPIRVAVGVTGAVLFIAVIFIAFGFIKARQRKYERLERRTEIRKSVHGSKASVYSNRGARSAAGGSYSRSKQRRQRPPMSASADFINLSGATLDETADTIDPIKMDFHRPSTPHSVLDYSGSKLDQSSYLDSDLGPSRSQFDYFSPPQLENEIRSVQPRPVDRYDNTMYYKNDAYDDDRSVDIARARSVSSMTTPTRRQAPYDLQGSRRTPYDLQEPRDVPYDLEGPSYSQAPSSRRPYSFEDDSSHNQSLAVSEGNLARHIREKPPRPRPKESAM